MKLRQFVPGFLGVLHMILTLFILFLALYLTGAVAKTVLFLCLFLAVSRLMTAFLIFSLVFDSEKIFALRPFLLAGAAVESFLALAVYFFDFTAVARAASILLGVPGAILTLSLPVCFCLFNLILAVYLLSYKGSSEQTVQYKEHYLPEFRETVIEE